MQGCLHALPVIPEQPRQYGVLGLANGLKALAVQPLDLQRAEQRLRQRMRHYSGRKVCHLSAARFTDTAGSVIMPYFQPELTPSHPLWPKASCTPPVKVSIGYRKPAAKPC